MNIMCMYVLMYVCLHASMYLGMHVCMLVCIYVCPYASTYVCMFVRWQLCKYASYIKLCHLLNVRIAMLCYACVQVGMYALKTTCKMLQLSITMNND